MILDADAVADVADNEAEGKALVDLGKEWGAGGERESARLSHVSMRLHCSLSHGRRLAYHDCPHRLLAAVNELNFGHAHPLREGQDFIVAKPDGRHGLLGRLPEVKATVL